METLSGEEPVLSQASRPPGNNVVKHDAVSLTLHKDSVWPHWAGWVLAGVLIKLQMFK